MTTQPTITPDMRRAGIRAATTARAEGWERQELREVLGMLGLIEFDPAPYRPRHHRRPTGRLG